MTDSLWFSTLIIFVVMVGVCRLLVAYWSLRDARYEAAKKPLSNRYYAGPRQGSSR